MRTIKEAKEHLDNIIKENEQSGCRLQLYEESAWRDLYETIIKNISLERLEQICEAERDGRLVVLPCKVGDTIIAFRYSNDKGLYFVSDKITSVTTNKSGYTIKTKSVFYPIKQSDGYDFAPISDYPYPLADYYIGSIEEAKAALKEK